MKKETKKQIKISVETSHSSEIEKPNIQPEIKGHLPFFKIHNLIKRGASPEDILQEIGSNKNSKNKDELVALFSKVDERVDRIFVVDKTLSSTDYFGLLIIAGVKDDLHPMPKPIRFVEMEHMFGCYFYEDWIAALLKLSKNKNFPEPDIKASQIPKDVHKIWKDGVVSERDNSIDLINSMHLLIPKRFWYSPEFFIDWFIALLWPKWEFKNLYTKECCDELESLLGIPALNKKTFERHVKKLGLKHRDQNRFS